MLLSKFGHHDTTDFLLHLLKIWNFEVAFGRKWSLEYVSYKPCPDDPCLYDEQSLFLWFLTRSIGKMFLNLSTVRRRTLFRLFKF